MKIILQKYFRLAFAHFELIVWISAIIILSFLPETPGLSLCIFKAIGFDRCPGCGIGNSIHHALRMKFTTSWNEHSMGILAVLIIFRRIFQLIPNKKITHAA